MLRRRCDRRKPRETRRSHITKRPNRYCRAPGPGSGGQYSQSWRERGLVMEGWKNALLGGTALIGAGLLGVGPAVAGATDGSSTSVSPSAFHADASTLLSAT